MAEQEEKLEKRRNYNLDEKLRLLEWDYTHKQLPKSKYPYFAGVINEKIEEGVIEEEKTIIKRK